MQHINVRRGLFRLWVIFTIVWCTAAAGTGGYLTYEEFQRASSQRLQQEERLETLTAVASVTPTLRTVPYATLEKIAQSSFNDEEQQIIVLGLEQGKTQEEIQLAIGRYRADRPSNPFLGDIPSPSEPWTYLLYTVLALFSVPLVTFAAGHAMLWAASGFRS